MRPLATSLPRQTAAPATPRAGAPAQAVQQMVAQAPLRMDTVGASAYLAETWAIKRTPGTLARMRSTGGGPAFRKAGARDVIYERASLDSWAVSLLGPAQATTREATTGV